MFGLIINFFWKCLVNHTWPLVPVMELEVRSFGYWDCFGVRLVAFIEEIFKNFFCFGWNMTSMFLCASLYQSAHVLQTYFHKEWLFQFSNNFLLLWCWPLSFKVPSSRRMLKLYFKHLWETCKSAHTITIINF